MASQNISLQASTIRTGGANLPELMSVPADHQDPNHPHFPGDLEQQRPTRSSCLGKNGLWVAGGALTVVLLTVVAVVGGFDLTKNGNVEGAKPTQALIATNTSLPAPLEAYTVYDNTTTFIYTTTRVPYLAVPSLATSTIILPPTSHAETTPEAPFRPMQVESASTLTTSDTIAPFDTPSGDTLSSDCLFSGAWALKEQCKKHCPTWDGHETHCEVSKRSQWVCVSCRLT